MANIRNLETFRDRFPTGEERDALILYSESLGARLVAVNEVETAKTEIVEEVMTHMKRMYPNIPRFHVSGFEKGYRDNTLLLEYMAKCMFLDDLELYDLQVLTWVRTLFKSFNFTPKFMRDNFTAMREAVKKRVRPRSFELMNPFLTHTIQYLSDIPEPVRPEV